MNKTNYEQGQIPTVADMNDGHLLTESALSDLVESVTGGKATVLFTNRPPTVVQFGANWKIDVLENYAAVDGRFFKVDATSFQTPIADKQIGIYFVLKETDVTMLRERLRDTGSAIVRESFNPVARKTESSRVVSTESAGSSIDPPAPSLAADDVGFIHYATVKSESGNYTIYLDTANLWNFPGGGLAVGVHAPQHMPGGGDPIPLAALGGPAGSTAGLMPTTALAVVKEAIQDVVQSPMSPYIVPTTTGTNTVSDPKQVKLQLKHHSSMEIKDVGGEKQLGVRFTSGPYAGDSGVAAQSNHKHPLEDSAVVMGTYRVEITTMAQLGTVITVPEFPAIAEIVGIEIYWAPPGSVQPKPAIPCSWFQDVSSQQMIGVRAMLLEPNQIALEIGNQALTRFIDSTRELITDPMFVGSVTWNSATGDGNTPTNGVLFVKVIGVRS